MLSMKHFRFLAMATLAALAVTLAAALPGVSADGGGDKAALIPRSDGTGGDNQAPPIPEKVELNYPNLGSHLDQLVASVEAGQATSKDAAGETPVYSGESVAVTIYLTGNVEEVVSFLEDNGGDPRNVGEDYIEAYVPVTLLGPVSEQPGVIRVREIIPPEPAQSSQGVPGHGPAAHLSTAWNEAGYSGQGVKVGIIDLGFEGFSGLMGTELPATVQARCYTNIGRFTQNLADCENGNDHGTIVAESLIDIAPQVDLYIGYPGVSNGDLQAVADWMVSEGVSVINYSVAERFDGPGNGTSPISISPLNTVDRAVTGGAVWVNSAGNHARTTWFARAPFLDQDRNGRIEFVPGDESNNMTLAAGDRIRVQLRWEGSWGGARTDLSIGLFNFDTREWVEIINDPQSGGSGHIPLELLVYTVPVDGDGHYGVLVGHASGSIPDWIQLMVWGVESIRHYTKYGSIVNPAESDNSGMLTVGSAHWNDVHAIEQDSSRGPTPDRRVKPDVVGADCGATALRPLNDYSSGFCGTSQAAPHVAGMVALVRQRFPSYTPTQVASYLKDNAEQRQSPDPNDTWGHGFARLPPPDGTAPPVPAPSNAFTRNPTADFNTLAGASNWPPVGMWSDGETMWVSDVFGSKIYAYDMATKARVSSKDFDTLQATGNIYPAGIWSDGETMWVLDPGPLWGNPKIYAYDMATKAWVSGKDFDTLQAAGNTFPLGFWSDGETIWVSDLFDGKIYAYDMATKARVSGKDFDTLKAAGNADPNGGPRGIWSDGMTMWVADSYKGKVYAYDMATKARVPGREFNTLDAAGNWIPIGIWSDGETMWVTDSQDTKIYAYRMPPAATGASATRSFSPASVAPGGQVVVTIAAANYGSTGGAVTETLPNGFSYLSSTHGAVTHPVDGNSQVVRFTLSGETSFTYTVTASDVDGPHTFSGILRDSDRKDHAVGGDTTVTVGDASATRSFSAASVAPGGQVVVTIAAANYGSAGAVTETLPNGFSYLSSTHGAVTHPVDGNSQVVRFTLSEETSFTYTVTASDVEGPHTFSGTMRDSDRNDHAVGGDTTVTVGGASATRSFSPASVAPGGQVVVTIAAANYGSTGGAVTETLPNGFSYLSSTHGAVTHPVDGNSQVVRFTLSGETSFTYTVTASDVDGPHTFSGTLRDSDRNDHAVGGDTTVTVGDAPPGVTVSYAGTAPVRIGTAIPVAATFTKAVSGFTVDDVAVGNGTAGNFSGSGASYTFDVTPNTIGQVTVDIAADVAEDADSNRNTAAMQLSLGIPYDDDRNGMIEKSEVVAAIDDYLFGDGSVKKSHVVALIDLYLFG